MITKPSTRDRKDAGNKGPAAGFVLIVKRNGGTESILLRELCVTAPQSGFSK